MKTEGRITIFLLAFTLLQFALVGPAQAEVHAACSNCGEFYVLSQKGFGFARNHVGLCGKCKDEHNLETPESDPDDDGVQPAIRYESYSSTTGGAFTVEGMGRGKFSLENSEGTKVASGSTGAKKPVDVPPGTYQLVLNGFARSLVVKAGQRAVVATGEVCVLSSGGAKGHWMWRLPGQNYDNRMMAAHDKSVELFAGDWDVKPGNFFYHNLTERRITVRPGRKLTLKTGAIKARGSSGLWSVYIGEEEMTKGQLAFGDVRHFFPGEYDVWHLLARTGPLSREHFKIATVKVQAGKLMEVKSRY